MKKSYYLILSVLVFLCSVTPAKSQLWTSLTSGTSASLIGVSVIDANTCFASGGGGIILKTTDGGNSWVTQTSGTTKDLYYIYFTDANNGYAAGNDGAAVKTTNGGLTWTPMTIPTGTVVSLRHINFIDDTTGYITGGTQPGNILGTILKTTDAGNTWISLPVNNAATDGIYSTFFTSPTVGYANDYDGHIIKTTNAGTSWSAYSTGTSNNFNGNLFFIDSLNGLVTGMNGVIYKTNNAGVSWSAVSSGTSNALTGMDFYDQNNGYIVGGDVNANTGKMLKTMDGGATWTNVVLPNGTNRLYKIDFLDATTAYAVGLNGVILKYSICPLNNWNSLTSGTTASLLGLSAINASICYVSGTGGALLKTTDGGNTWILQTSGTTKDLYANFFTNVNNGYAVGNDGVALKTTNGGITWTAMTVPTGNVVSFRHINFIDDTTGYITGGTQPGNILGTILKTTDAGNTWISLPVSNAATDGIYSTFFTSPAVGYSHDWDGNILKTTNAGASWSSYATGTSSLAGTIFFTDSINGLVTGGNGVIFKTSNAGNSWITVNSGTSDALNGVDFYSPNNGYVVGGNINANTGRMIKTTDGGNTWTNVGLPSGTNRLNRVDFLDGNTAYAVGLNGTILKYSACPPTILISTSSINASSYGVCDGSANVSVTSTSGTGYTCLWSTGHATPYISGICAGTYTITITDGLGFAAVDTVVITEPSDSAIIDSTFIISTTGTNVSISGNCDGTASVTVTGGTPPYSYFWSTGDTVTSVSNLCSNVYYITVTDSAGQSLSSTVYISEPTDTITDSISYPPIDTLYTDPIDSCIVDFTQPIDSAYITAFTITDSMTVIIDWTLWQNGTGVTITTETEYTNFGFNMFVLTLYCSTLTRELYGTVVRDVIDTSPVSTGMNVLKDNTQIKIYPNPFKDQLHMELVMSTRSETKINIINSLGQVVHNTNRLLEKGNNQFIIDTENLNPGIYFIQTISNGKTTVSKLIK